MTQFRPTGFGVLPPVIKNLLIINALVFLAQNTLAGPAMSFSFEDTFALHAYQSASGAVFGILIAFVYLFPNTYIYIYFFLPMKAKWLGIIYFSFELYTALQNAPGDGVARWAHVGGAVIGFVLVFIWKKNNRRY